MKRIISFVLVAAMLLTAMMFTPTASANATADNTSADAYYFGGTLKFHDRTGRVVGGSVPVEDETMTVKDGDSTKGTITIDGIIEAGEWGTPSISVSSDDAALSVVAKDPIQNPKFEFGSAENTYLFQKLGTNVKLGFTAYLLWDEDYFYVASHVVDPDGFCIVNYGDSAWDGDAFQFRIDYQGPNSIAEGGEYNPGTGYKDGSAKNPWKGSEYVGASAGTLGNEKFSQIGNFVFAYTVKEPGYTECWDAAPRWNVTEDATTMQKTGEQRAIDYSTELDDKTYAVAYPRTESVEGVNTYITEYEIAIPWALIDSVYAPTNYTPAIGNVLGMSISLLNGKRGDSSYNSFLEWGNGVCGYRTVWDPQTCGGSNAVTLSGTAYSAHVACTHSFNAANCTAPETCSLCGYKKGFKSGHSYEYSNMTLPTDTTNGSITATCPICGDVVNKTIPMGDKTVLHAFNTTSGDIINTGFNEGWSNTWKDHFDNPLLDENGKAVTSYNTKQFGYAVSDCVSNGSEFNSTLNESVTLPDGTIDPPITYNDQSGTYFSTEDDVDNSFTFKLDIYMTGFDDRSAWTYTPGIYNMFGGSDDITTVAGVFKVEGQYYFAIAPRVLVQTYIDYNGDVIMHQADFEAACYAFTKADASVVSLNAWHEMVFMFDQESATAALYWDKAPVASATDYHLPYTESGSHHACFIRRMGVPFYAKNIEVGSSAKASDYINVAPSTYTLTVNYTTATNGVTSTQQIVKQLAPGEAYDVQLDSNFYRVDAYTYRFYEWTGDAAELADATYACKAAVTGTMPSNDVTITAEYKLVGDIFEDGLLNGKDGNFMAQIGSGDMPGKFAADVNYDGLWNGKDGNLMQQIISGDYIPAMVANDAIIIVTD